MRGRANKHLEHNVQKQHTYNIDLQRYKREKDHANQYAWYTCIYIYINIYLYIYIYMSQVTKVWLSGYLVLLSNDSKTR